MHHAVVIVTETLLPHYIVQLRGQNWRGRRSTQNR